MSRFELTINVDYVPHWTIQDGLRELIQNALDESVINSSNSMSITRDGNILSISTKNAKLDKSSLLIGSSSKRDNTATIGKEGEGYKLACLVLIRAGCNVQIHNYHEREKWTPKIIKSRRYNSKLMVIDTEKFVFTSPPTNDLSFKVDGITDEIYKELTKRVLFLNKTPSRVLKHPDIGEVLLNENEAGRIYVNGLYVSTIKDGIKFGYNFRPDKIELDRDRRAVTDFNLTWETSKLWAKIGNEHSKLLHVLVNTNCKDVHYINSHFKSPVLNDSAYDNFKEEFGNNCYPVSNQVEHDHITKTYENVKPVIVNETRQELIKSSTSFTRKTQSFKTKEADKTPTEILEEFIGEFYEELNNNSLMSEKFKQIIELSQNWRS